MKQMTELEYILFEILADTGNYGEAYEMIKDSIERGVWDLIHPLGKDR